MPLFLQFLLDTEKSWCFFFFPLSIARVAEHNSELQKEDLDKEIAALKEENLRLREDKIQLRAQAEEDTQINKELQEQLGQLTKHVKVDSVTDEQKSLSGKCFLNLVWLYILICVGDTRVT